MPLWEISNMKIRIKGNSIRYRPTKTEIDNFGRNGWLEEKTEFLNGPSFHYRLERKAGIENMEASFCGNRICIFVPEKITTEWTTTDIVGFDTKIKIGIVKELALLVEKDLVCLDHTFEDQSDNFPNPNKAC
jgi:hypothetical protein